MLSTPRAGWSNITIGDWTDRCSYIQDIPFLLLDALEEAYYEDKATAVNIDAEGYDYTIIFDTFNTHIIKETENCEWSYKTIDIHLEKIILSFIHDIKADLDRWALWEFDEDIYERKWQLQTRCDALYKNIIKYKEYEVL